MNPSLARQLTQISFTPGRGAQRFDASLSVEVEANLGESPRYDHRTGNLLIVDITGNPPERSLALVVVDPINRNFRRIPLEHSAGMVALTTNPELVLVAQASAFVPFDITTGRCCGNPMNLESPTGHRLNDGFVPAFDDPNHLLNGRLIVGGISEASPRQPTASLHEYSPTGNYRRLIDGGITNSNGIDTLGNFLLHTDTGTSRITFYKFDPDTRVYPLLRPERIIDFGSLKEKNPLTDNTKPGPDGLRVGSFGGQPIILIALFRAGKIIGIRETGEHVLTIEGLPPLVTSPEIVDSRVYITTAQDNSPGSGSLFVAEIPGLSARQRGLFGQ